MADKYLCRGCSKVVTCTTRGRYRTHTDSVGDPCDQSGEFIPGDLEPVSADASPDVPVEGQDFAICPQCGRKVKLSRMGYFEPHDQTLRGGDRCPVSGVRAIHARKTDDVTLPGDEKPKPGADRPAVSAQEEITSPAPTSESAPAASSPTELLPSSGATEAETPTLADASQSSPESTSTPTPSEPSTEDSTSSSGDSGPFHLAPLLDEKILQPFSHILQPFEAPPRLKIAESMSDRGKEIAARLREIFYAYTNRNSSDNRSAQKTLGPSEAGSPCDRQIAMKLMGVKPVNPQEGWAPFVGTAVHVELAKMFEWANGSGSGRYVTEMPLTFGSAVVPRGTSDLLDRVLFMIMDHKLMGRWSIDKLIQNGPSETYRIQGQIYALGAVLAGEKVKEVAIVGWPRQESSLDKLYVHVEPFDRKLAEAALKRVERIAEEVAGHQGKRATYAGLDVNAHHLEIAKEFEVGDDCKWCPFHLKNDKEMKRGCPGK